VFSQTIHPLSPTVNEIKNAANGLRALHLATNVTTSNPKTNGMNSTLFPKAGFLAALSALLFLLCWEGYWRSRGFEPTYNDDKALWAQKRAEIYQPRDKATVFIGSSRIKFDLDIPTWKNLTGENAVQLSLVGTSPMLLLKDLAEDEKFRGKLVVDLTEVLFFSQNPVFHKSAKEAINFYKNQSPSERLSSRINFALESQFAFLEERRFSMNTLLNDLEIPNRPGVFVVPPFPKGFEWTTFDRQTYMSDMFLTDSTEIKRQTSIWSVLIMSDKTPPIDGKILQETFDEIKLAVDKIKSRGGQVVFIRTPSSGPMEEGEQKVYPRQKYWDALLTYTNTPGIHYLDNPVTASLICPEWSHLAPKDAVVYTRELIKSLQQKSWFAAQSTL